MKFIFLLGGFTGFALTAFTGWCADRAPDRILLDAALGCLAGAVLFRWFWNVLLSALRETLVARHRAAAAVAIPPAKTK